MFEKNELCFSYKCIRLFFGFHPFRCSFSLPFCLVCVRSPAGVRTSCASCSDKAWPFRTPASLSFLRLCF